MTPHPAQPPRTARHADPQRRPSAQPVDGSEGDLFDLGLLRLFWDRRWLILGCMVVALVLGVFQVKRTTPIYTSTAVLRFEAAGRQVVDFGERSRIIYSRDEIRTAAQLIRTPAIAEQVLAALDEGTAESLEVRDASPLARLAERVVALQRAVRGWVVSYEPPRVDQERLDQQNASRALLNTVSVSLRPDTKLIEIGVSVSDPARAERICDEFCRQFIRRQADERRESFSYAREYINQQIAQTKDRLEAAEKALFEYAGQSDMKLMEGDREIALGTLTKLSSDIEQVKNELALLAAEAEPALAREQAVQALRLEKQGTLARLAERRDEILVEISELRAENREGFLPLVRLEREVETLDSQIAEASEAFIAAYVGARETALAAARQRLTALEKRLAEHQERVNAIELSMIRFRVLERDVDATRQIFNILLDQFKRLEVTDDASVSTVTIEAPASIPTVPSEPNVTRTLAGFLSFGLLLGCAAAFALNKIDRSVKDPREVERQLGLPTLAQIPCLRGPSRLGLGRKGEVRHIAPFDESVHQVGSEAFRYLRTSINYSSADGATKVILVTSCFPSEGKSTIASNLGIFFAEQAKRVLVVDGDLKKPAVHKCYQIARYPGLSDVLTGQSTLEDAMHRFAGAEGLDVLPAGQATPSSTALLESQAMAKFLEDMRSRYDVIILDCSPADQLADALILARLTDGIVLTVRRGHTPLHALARVAEKLGSLGTPILGAVYNSTRPGDQGTGYGKYYGSYAYGKDSKG